MAVMPVFDVAAAQAAERRALALGAAGLAVFLAWQALVVRSHARVAPRAPSIDAARHLSAALAYREAAVSGWQAAWRALPPPQAPVAPAYHWALAAAAGRGEAAAAALWVQWCYMALLTVSLFGLAWHFRPDATALAAPLAFAASPALQRLLTSPAPELPAAALAAAALWALAACAGFTRWAPTLAFGALFGLGLLHKPAFCGYLAASYLVGLGALVTPGARGGAVVAAGLAGAIALPWYLYHAPELLLRAAQVVAGWGAARGSWTALLLQSLEGFGPLFAVLGWLGLAAPHHRRHWEQGWALSFTVLTALIAWSLLPGAQLRFLVPALPGLAAVFAGAWPDALIWPTVAVQLFLAANFSAGWLEGVSIPGPSRPLALFDSRPPRADDWRLAEIAAEARRRHRAQFAIGNITLLADDPSLNVETLAWTIRRLGLRELAVRRPNARLCELSEFVLLKAADKGGRGRAASAPPLRGPAAAVTERDGWFSRSYEKVAEWPLPDGAKAVLFQQRALTRAPFAMSTIGFEHYDAGGTVFREARIELGRWDARDGSYPLVKVRAKVVEFAGIKLSRLSLELERALLVPAAPEGSGAGEWTDLRVLRFATLRLKSASIPAETVRRLLESGIEGLRVESIALNGTARLAGALGPLRVAGEVAVEPDPAARRLRLRVISARIGATALPVFSFDRLDGLRIPLEPRPEAPFAIELPGVTLARQAVSVP